jgi:hypothetical protein
MAKSEIILGVTTDDLNDLATLLVEFNTLHASALPHIYVRTVPDAQNLEPNASTEQNTDPGWRLTRTSPPLHQSGADR